MITGHGAREFARLVFTLVVATELASAELRSDFSYTIRIITENYDRLEKQINATITNLKANCKVRNE